jgi:hypothetical protein
VKVSVVAQILATPIRQAGAAASVLEQHGLSVEIYLRAPDDPHKLLELVRVRRWQLRAAGVVKLAEYQSVTFRQRAKSHLHIEIRCRPDYAPRFR